MNQFKIGDKVRCINPGTNVNVTTGKIYIVTNCTYDMTYFRGDNDNIKGLYTYRFELVKNSTKHLPEWF